MAAQLQVGDLVGQRWRLTGFLGKGAFGQVFSATDESSLQLGAAAVKVLHPNTAPAERAEFVNEVKKIAQLRHPNLVSYLDSGEYVGPDGGAAAYLVTERCDTSLDGHLATLPGRRMAPGDAEALLVDVSAGLAHLHGRNLLHRDLKPANVLRSGLDWKLADFGLARDLTATGHYHRGDVVRGTPLYMAPEIFDSAQTSAAADVYALGVMLHLALTGRVVHEASDDVALLARLATTTPSIDPSLPPDWRRLIEATVQREPTARPPAADLVDLLHSPIASSTPSARPTWQPPTMASSPRLGPGPHTPHPAASSPQVRGPVGATSEIPSRLPLVAALVVAGVLAAVVGVFALSRLVGDDTGNPASEDTASEDTATGNAITDDTDAGNPATDDNGTGVEPPAAAVPADDDPLDGASPEERVEQVVLQATDVPEGYDHALFTPTTGDFCVGVDGVWTAHPGIASRSAEVESPEIGHVFIVRADVHASVEAAHRTLAYAERLASTCDGQPVDASDDPQIYTMTLLPDLEVAGADAVTAYRVLVEGGSLPTVELTTIYARADDLTILSTGSHQGTTIYHAELMMARATGAEAPTPVEPDTVPGTFFGSEAAATVRAVAPSADLTPTVSEWIETSTDAQLDQVFDRICSAVRQADNPFEMVQAILDLRSELDADLVGDLNDDHLSELAGVGILFYCPEEAERLGLI